MVGHISKTKAKNKLVKHQLSPNNLAIPQEAVVMDLNLVHNNLNSQPFKLKLILNNQLLMDLILVMMKTQY